MSATRSTFCPKRRSGWQRYSLITAICISLNIIWLFQLFIIITHHLSKDTKQSIRMEKNRDLSDFEHDMVVAWQADLSISVTADLLGFSPYNHVYSLQRNWSEIEQQRLPVWERLVDARGQNGQAVLSRQEDNCNNLSLFVLCTLRCAFQKEHLGMLTHETLSRWTTENHTGFHCC